MPVNLTVNISLLANAVLYRGEQIDPLAPDAAARLRELLGPAIASHSFPGSTRTAEVLRGGVILLTQDGGTELLSLLVCFDPQDGSPYSAFRELPVFPGEVECAGPRFFAGESEAAVRKLPGIRGFAGALTMDLGSLHLGLHFKKPRDQSGTRTGDRQLVYVTAEWGGIKGFGTAKP
jgi:hypothetical protein